MHCQQVIRSTKSFVGTGYWFFVILSFQEQMPTKAGVYEWKCHEIRSPPKKGRLCFGAQTKVVTLTEVRASFRQINTFNTILFSLNLLIINKL